MKPPADLPPVLVALGEAFARRAGIDPGDFWAYVYRRAAPPPEVRDSIVAAFFPRVPPESFLTAPATDATLATEMQPGTRQTRVSRARLRKDNRRHPFVAALVKAGATVTEVAHDLGYPRSTVQSWYDANEGNRRPIPRAAANAISRRFGVPVATWTKIVD